MDSGIIIRELQNREAAAAKNLIISVVAVVYGWAGSLKDLEQDLDRRNIFYDLEDIAASYTRKGGLFLGAFDQGKLVGTGAVWPLEEHKCELKRMWLLPEYWGRGIGHALIQRIFAHAHKQGWRCIYLCTDREQERAINFYHQVGFLDTKERQEKCGEDDFSMVYSLVLS